MRRLILVLSLVPTLAFAQASAPQPPQPDLILLPRQLAESAMQWIAAPNATDAVQLFALLQACLADNPVGGLVRRSGPDQCPQVTQALAAQSRGLADAKKAAAKPK
jgi:hypothetical protein